MVFVNHLFVCCNGNSYKATWDLIQEQTGSEVSREVNMMNNIPSDNPKECYVI